ncbi:MAG: hypothetical protein HQK83_06465 [Fibrobacteria bacterium]|nr:hypothetical protein [Fibrobacteria bacterium]
MNNKKISPDMDKPVLNMKLISSIIFFFLLESIAEKNQTGTMHEDNLNSSGFLIINEKETRWKDWESTKNMVLQDSSGTIFPFLPPVITKYEKSNPQNPDNTAKKWFSSINPQQNDSGGVKGEKLEKKELITEDMNRNTDMEEEMVKSVPENDRISEKKKVVPQKIDPDNDIRYTPPEKVIPE